MLPASAWSVVRIFPAHELTCVQTRSRRNMTPSLRHLSVSLGKAHHLVVSAALKLQRLRFLYVSGRISLEGAPRFLFGAVGNEVESPERRLVLRFTINQTKR
eukprot:4894169-Pyramimonas_sp.AAC.1